MNSTQILKRLFNEYTKKYLPQIFLALIFSLILAASTSSIAWLLDPAVKKIFIEQNKLKDFDEARLLPSSKDLESLI